MVWDELVATGRYQMRHMSSIESGFPDAYAWMRRRLVARFGWELGDAWPVWGWPRIRRSDLVYECSYSGSNVLLTMDVPRNLLVYSQFDAWHSVLNSSMLYPPDLQLEEDEEWDAWVEETDSRLRALGGERYAPMATWTDAARRYVEESWESIFDVGAWPTRSYFQCVMPEIRMEWVTRACLIEGPARRHVSSSEP